MATNEELTGSFFGQGLTVTLYKKSLDFYNDGSEKVIATIYYSLKKLTLKQKCIELIIKDRDI